MEAAPHDPAAAVTWAALIRNETLRAQAYGSIVYWWARRDRTAATAWVEALPAGPARDAALASLRKK